MRADRPSYTARFANASVDCGETTEKTACVGSRLRRILFDIRQLLKQRRGFSDR